MRRRTLVLVFLAGLVLCAAPVLAQQPAPAPVPRVGILTPAESDQTPIFEAFRRGLKDLGYMEGRNIAVEFRSARGNSALLPRLAAELVALPVDIILTDGAAAASGSASYPANPYSDWDKWRGSRAHWVGRKPASAWRQSHRVYAHARAARGKAGRLAANAGARSQGADRAREPGSRFRSLGFDNRE